MKRYLIIFSLLLFVFPLGILAAEKKENSIRTGGIVDVNDPIAGDLIVFGNVVTIRGTVAGDVLAAGTTITVLGNVTGSVRALGATVIIDSTIGRNVTVAGESVIFSKKAAIGESVAVFADEANIDGTVEGRLDARVNRLEVNGLVKGEVHETRLHTPASSGERFSEYLFGRVIALFGLLVVGLVLISLVRSPTATVIRFALERALPSLGWGLVFFFTPPIIAVFLFFTVIGAPLSLILFSLWAIALYSAQVFAALAIGIRVVLLLDRKKKITTLLLPLIFGCLAWVLIVSIPYIGWIVWFVGAAWGLGALLDMKRRIVLELMSRK